jgi:hypothetical protein
VARYHHHIESSQKMVDGLHSSPSSRRPPCVAHRCSPRFALQGNSSRDPNPPRSHSLTPHASEARNPWMELIFYRKKNLGWSRSPSAGPRRSVHAMNQAHARTHCRARVHQQHSPRLAVVQACRRGSVREIKGLFITAPAPIFPVERSFKKKLF